MRSSPEDTTCSNDSVSKGLDFTIKLQFPDYMLAYLVSRAKFIEKYN